MCIKIIKKIKQLTIIDCEDKIAQKNSFVAHDIKN